MHYWLVMPAAGAGRRFGGTHRKQHLPLAAGTLLDCALQPFLHDARCRGGVVVLAADDSQRSGLRQRLSRTFQVVEGGAERVHSVLNGLVALAALAAPADWVLVHDAVRPCLSQADLARLCDTLAQHPVGGLLATPVADTVKRAGAPAAVAAAIPAGAAAAIAVSATAAPAAPPECVATVAREVLWLAQTPQMFRYELLRRALQQALASGRLPTDEAQALEWQGLRPALVAAQDSNIKITRSADLALAAAILAARLE